MRRQGRLRQMRRVLVPSLRTQFQVELLEDRTVPAGAFWDPAFVAGPPTVPTSLLSQTDSEIEPTQEQGDNATNSGTITNEVFIAGGTGDLPKIIDNANLADMNIILIHRSSSTTTGDANQGLSVSNAANKDSPIRNSANTVTSPSANVDAVNTNQPTYGIGSIQSTSQVAGSLDPDNALIAPSDTTDGTIDDEAEISIETTKEQGNFAFNSGTLINSIFVDGGLSDIGIFINNSTLTGVNFAVIHASASVLINSANVAAGPVGAISTVNTNRPSYDIGAIASTSQVAGVIGPDQAVIRQGAGGDGASEVSIETTEEQGNFASNSGTILDSVFIDGGLGDIGLIINNSTLTNVTITIIHLSDSLLDDSANIEAGPVQDVSTVNGNEPVYDIDSIASTSQVAGVIGPEEAVVVQSETVGGEAEASIETTKEQGNFATNSGTLIDSIFVSGGMGEIGFVVNNSTLTGVNVAIVHASESLLIDAANIAAGPIQDVVTVNTNQPDGIIGEIESTSRVEGSIDRDEAVVDQTGSSDEAGDASEASIETTKEQGNYASNSGSVLGSLFVDGGTGDVSLIVNNSILTGVNFAIVHASESVIVNTGNVAAGPIGDVEAHNINEPVYDIVGIESDSRVAASSGPDQAVIGGPTDSSSGSTIGQATIETTKEQNNAATNSGTLLNSFFVDGGTGDIADILYQTTLAGVNISTPHASDSRMVGTGNIHALDVRDLFSLNTIRPVYGIGDIASASEVVASIVDDQAGIGGQLGSSSGGTIVQASIETTKEQGNFSTNSGSVLDSFFLDGGTGDIANIVYQTALTAVNITTPHASTSVMPTTANIDAGPVLEVSTDNTNQPIYAVGGIESDSRVAALIGPDQAVIGVQPNGTISQATIETTKEQGNFATNSGTLINGFFLDGGTGDIANIIYQATLTAVNLSTPHASQTRMESAGNLSALEVRNASSLHDTNPVFDDDRIVSTSPVAALIVSDQVIIDDDATIETTEEQGNFATDSGTVLDSYFLDGGTGVIANIVGQSTLTAFLRATPHTTDSQVPSATLFFERSPLLIADRQPQATRS
ncbi:hypothetical protein [Planctomycetes bacterium Pan216]